MRLLSVGMMNWPGGALPTLGVGSGGIHGTTLIDVAWRGSLGWIFGCVGVMTSQTIAVSCERASRLLLGNFAKGVGGWVFLGLRPII